jgi:hypothetical protein
MRQGEPKKSADYPSSGEAEARSGMLRRGAAEGKKPGNPEFPWMGWPSLGF